VAPRREHALVRSVVKVDRLLLFLNLVLLLFVVLIPFATATEPVA
jgi:uncharacterized membrane protein